jgi:hypothetical protein
VHVDYGAKRYFFSFRMAAFAVFLLARKKKEKTELQKQQCFE